MLVNELWLALALLAAMVIAALAVFLAYRLGLSRGGENARQTLQQAETAKVRLEVQLQQMDAVRGEGNRLRLELQSVREQYAALEAQHRSEQSHFEQQLLLLREAKGSLSQEFETLANKIFTAKQQQFNQASQQQMDGTLGPLRQQLKDFREQIERAYTQENAERNKLVGQISELQKQAQQIGQDAVNLASALKGNNKAQGDWGEVILTRLLEESGLHNGREYDVQAHHKDEHGNHRHPDVVVHLPDNKDIVVDAKVSLVHYERYCSSDDAAEKALALKEHIQSVKNHIVNLSGKNYDNLPGLRTLDFVFLFVPIEAAFMTAMAHDTTLYRYAYDRHIILVSPTTLLATLRTIESLWRNEKQNQNAEKIATMAGGLHDQFSRLLDDLEQLGGYLDKAQRAFDITTDRIQSGRGNLLKRIGDLKKLGAKTKRQLPPPTELKVVKGRETEKETEQETD